jgi:hypothetical protein
VRRFGAMPPQASNPAFAAATAASTSSTPPRATSAIGSSSIGETSVNASAEPTRSPPIQWSVETSMPSTRTRPLSAASSRRSYPNGMERSEPMSNRLP